jgi:hypothetical protein
MAGITGYVAGPVVCALVSALGGMAISVATMVLMPFWTLLRDSNARSALD